MTRSVVYRIKCPECGEDVTCPHCGAEIPRFSPFSDWLRNLSSPLDSSSISNQNLDYIWHNFWESWLITLEEKQFGATPDVAQRDTHGVVAQLLAIGSSSGKKVETIRGERQVEYRGHYVVSFERTMPDDSQWIRVNGNQYESEAIFELLKKGEPPPHL